MAEAYFMGIDTGTNSSKGVLINDSGEIVAEYSTEHSMSNCRNLVKRKINSFSKACFTNNSSI